MSAGRLALGALVAWMVLGPVSTQVFHVRNPFLPAWHMYRGWGSDVVVVRLNRIEGGTPVRVDRAALLGLGPSVAARRLRTPAQLERQIRTICASLPPDADLRVVARVGKVHGWKTFRTGARNACR